MNKLIVAMLSAAVLPLAAQAQQSSPASEMNKSGATTRAEVLAELKRAQASGEYARINSEGQEATHPEAAASWEAMRSARNAQKTQRDPQQQ